jgi:hypothetical protein
MFMPKESQNSCPSIIDKISSQIASTAAELTGSPYWSQLKGVLGLGDNQILDQRRVQVPAKIKKSLVYSHVETFEIWGTVGDYLRVAMGYHSKGRNDGNFDEKPVVVEEKLNGDPNKQAEAILKRLHEEHDHLDFRK